LAELWVDASWFFVLEVFESTESMVIREKGSFLHELEALEIIVSQKSVSVAVSNKIVSEVRLVLLDISALVQREIGQTDSIISLR